MNGKISKSFTIICALFPIIFLYSTNISGITIADISLIIWMLFGIVNIIKSRTFRIQRYQIPFLLLTIYIFLVMIIGIVKGYTYSESMKTGRYFIYFMTVSLFCITFLDKQYFESIYTLIALFVSVFLILQAILWNFFQIKLPGYLPFLRITNSGSYQIAQTNAIRITTYRPCSVFAEPAHFAAYVLGALALLLYRDRLKEACILSLAMALSSSSTGILCTLFAWIVWFIVKHKSTINFRHIAILIIFIATGYYLASKNSQIQLFINRTITTDSAITGRFNSYTHFATIYEASSWINKIIGHGITEMDTYITGIPQFIYSFGIIGTSLLISCILSVLSKHKWESIITMSCLLILSIGTQALVSYLVIIYLGYSVGLEEYNSYERNR